VITTDGAKFTPAGTHTPITLQPGLFLFSGDALNVSGGQVRLLWCPKGAPAAFEYRIHGNFDASLGETPPALSGAQEVAGCRLPALERRPEVATTPSLDEVVPPPIPPNKIDEAIADTPPDTASALQALRQRDLADPANRLFFAVALADAGLADEAIDQYAVLARLWPAEPRLKKLIVDLRQMGGTREIVHPNQPAPEPAAAHPAGNVYALVIGIKTYEQAEIPDLLFADADAEDFAKFAASDRGGKAEVVTLINQQARASEIRNRLTELMAKLRKDDTFVLFVAAHGDMRGDTPMLVTYRANPQDTAINGIPLSEIQKLRFGVKSPFKEVRVFLDICHAGNIALLDGPPLKGRPATAATPPPADTLFFTATHQGPDALAYEDPKFGHGVFTYFLLRALDTDDARQSPADRYLTAGGLSKFVETWVQNATTSERDRKARQKPTTILGVGLGHELVDLSLPGPAFRDTRPLASMTIPENRLGKLRRQLPSKKEASPQMEAARADASETDQRVALEDEGEAILLRYLEGDENPQERGDFARCAALFADALRLQPHSPYLEARQVFCDGRVSVFDKRYDDAIGQLERSILLDPTAAYSYNALGIAYLEKGDYQTARLALEDAIGRAPNWAYPRHNLALANTQAGDYDAAIAGYRDAIRRAPNYFYLPHNLGLLFQRMNRLDEAEAEYRIAIRNAARHTPGRSEPYIALGLLKATEGKSAEAEGYYRKALNIPAAELSTRTARHNLAVLLAKDSKRRSEAEQMWIDNGDYLPSQLALAQHYAAEKRSADAIRVYREILRSVPDHLSGRLRLAAELEKSGDRNGAIIELRAAAAQQPENALIREDLARVLSASGHATEALAVYRTALADAPDAATRSRIRTAIKRLERIR
jgi:tetratricopeptide (TPR) repeat protein